MAPPSIPDFHRLNPITSIYHPAESTSPPQHALPSPDLIVLCTWMAAQPKHIAKYTSGYRHLFPTASILLIESNLVDMFTGSDLRQALSVVRGRLETAGREGERLSMLLCMFSNGGSNNAVWLCQSLGSSPFDAMVLDCCPGRADLMSTTQAMTLSLPNYSLLRSVGWYFVFGFMLGYMAVFETLRLENTVSRIRRQLNDTVVFGKDTPRLYLYSEKDALVRHTDVHDHAEEARRAGYVDVKEEVFVKAPHCALLNEDAERYWNAVNEHVAKSIK